MKNLFLSMLAMAAMVSCTNEIADNSEKVDNGQPQAIKFGSSILGVTTKVSGTGANEKFDEKDKIKVYGYKGTKTPTGYLAEVPFMKDVEFTYGTGFTTTDPSAVWERGAHHYFYSFYPSTLIVNSAEADKAPSITIPVVETTGIVNDIMYAKTEHDYTSATISPVTLAFSHKLAKVKFEFKKASGVPLTEVSALSFVTDKSSGEMDLITGNITSTTGDITLAATIGNAITVAEGATSTPIPNFSPMVLANSTIKSAALTINGQELSINDISAVISAGSVTTVTITVNAKGVSFASSIAGWTDTAGSGTVE